MTEKEEFQKTCNVIPDGVQTLSKMPCRHVEGVYPFYIERGEGPYIFDGEGKKYIDYPCGLGTILLGHNIEYVNQAIRSQLKKGILFPLPSRLETQLAEKIVELIPCAEMVRFVKTGSEATSAAIKIARTYTDRQNVLCCGYHGWHDWYNITTPINTGVPDCYKKLISRIENKDNGSQKTQPNKDTAAVILEPYIYESPKGSFLEQVIKIAHENGSLVIFDEMVTGLRTIHGSAQAFFSVKPDIACFGKSWANGLPLAYVCGTRTVMESLQRCFVSSTFGGELLSIAAAIATIEFWQKFGVADYIWEMGNILIREYKNIAKKYNLNTSISGLPCRTFLNFPTEEHKSLFWQECLKRGVFLGYAQFVSYAHDITVINRTIAVMEESLAICQQAWDEPGKILKGKTAQATLRHKVFEKENKNDEHKRGSTVGINKRGRPNRSGSSEQFDGSPENTLSTDPGRSIAISEGTSNQ